MSVNGVTFNPSLNYPKYTFQSSGDTVDAVDSDSYIEEGAALAKETAYDALNAAFAPVRGVLTLMGMRCGKITDKWIDKDRWPRDGAVEDAYVADGEAGVSDAGDALVEAGLPEAGIDAEVDASDAQVCTPQTITETDFTVGDLNNLDNTSFPGSLILDRNCTYRWNAESGLLPTQVTMNPWTLNNPSGGTVELTTDPITGLPALRLRSIGLNDILRYELIPSFSNLNGWVVEVEVRVADNSEIEAGLAACGFDLADGAKRIRIDIRNDRVIETISGLEYLMDTTNTAHIYNIRGIDNDFYVDVDGLSNAIDGTDAMTFGILEQRFHWNDISQNPDSEVYWYKLCSYDNDTIIPYQISGDYEQVFNLGPSVVRIDSLTSTVDIPTDTSITFETRTGNVPVPDGTWSLWQALGAGNSILSPAAQYIQIRSNFVTVDPNKTARLYDLGLNFCVQ